MRESDRIVIYPNGGRVASKSADNPDSLRGEKLGGVVLDEFAQIKEETWFEVLRPALTDLKGWALFIGTPKGKNWAYRLFERAKVVKNWDCFQMPTSSNPYIDPEEIADAKVHMSEEAFAQEFEADFGYSQYLVFPEVNPDFHEWRGPVPEFISYHGGMDFGGDTIGAHKSATAIAGRTEKDELIIFAAFKQSGPNIAERQLNWYWEQDNRLKEVSHAARVSYNGIISRADKSQSVAIQFMRNSGVHVFPTKGGPDSVEAGIEIMHRRFKLRTKGEGDSGPTLYWLRPESRIAEGCHFVRDDLMKYRYPEPKDVDEVQKKNPLKVDDDLVDAIRYLVEGVDGLIIGDPQKLYAGSIPKIV